MPKHAQLSPAGMWVFRRLDYTRASNPEFVYTVLSGDGMARHMGTFSALVPSCDDAMEALEASIFNSASGIRDTKAPCAVSFDAIEIIEPLKQLLEPTGIVVLYYAPPSKEEEAVRHPQRPMGTRECALCRQSAEEAGVRTLLKCSRCKAAFYCGLAHQKEHWKHHKHECGNQ